MVRIVSRKEIESIKNKPEINNHVTGPSIRLLMRSREYSDSVMQDLQKILASNKEMSIDLQEFQANQYLLSVLALFNNFVIGMNKAGSESFDCDQRKIDKTKKANGGDVKLSCSVINQDAVLTYRIEEQAIGEGQSIRLFTFGYKQRMQPINETPTEEFHQFQSLVMPATIDDWLGDIDTEFEPVNKSSSSIHALQIIKMMIDSIYDNFLKAD